MRFLPFLIAGAALAAPAAALAHPHIFAEARLEVVAGEDGTITELRNVWRFDEMFSASVVMDFDKNSNAELDPDELAEVVLVAVLDGVDERLVERDEEVRAVGLNHPERGDALDEVVEHWSSELASAKTAKRQTK